MRVLIVCSLLCAATVSPADTTVLELSAGEPLIGVVASRTRGGPIATWSERHVFISRDGGLTFTSHRLDYTSVAVAGQYVYWRNEDMLFVDGAERLTQQPLPKIGQRFGLFAGGRWVALLGHDRVTISDDQGMSWRALEVPGRGNAGEELLIEDDGALQWMIGSEAGCGGGYQSRSLGRIGGGWHDAPWPLDTPGSFVIAPGGWAYAPDTDCDPDHQQRLCAVGKSAAALAIPPTRDFAFGHDGKNILIAATGRLYDIRGARATDLGTAPRKTTALTTSSDGTTLAIATGRLFLRDRSTWRPLTVH